MEYQMKAYLNGKMIDSDKHVNIISPLTRKVVGRVPALDAKMIDYAFQSANQVFKTWSQTPLTRREQLLNTFIKLLDVNKSDIAHLMHQEIGKSVAESMVEIERSLEYASKTIALWKQIKLQEVVIGSKHSYQHRVPLGVVLAISPFNYPLNLSLSKIIPALISGNTIVFKAATNGSLTGAFIAQLIDQSKFPPGVFNYVTGRGRDIGDLLTAHPLIKMITFTGGTNVGQRIAQANPLKPLVLELGGNDAAYVRCDANLDLAAREIASGAFGFGGQRCTAIKRLIIDHAIADQLIAKLVPLVQKIKLPPLIDSSSFTHVHNLFEQALSQGAELICGGDFQDQYLSATIIKVINKQKLWYDEPFGPILPFVITTSDEEALALINDSNYGLQNSLFTTDLKWAQQVALTIESGTVNINGKSSRGPDEFPFLGIKASGFGTQGISYALKSMTRILNVVVNQI